MELKFPKVRFRNYVIFPLWLPRFYLWDTFVGENGIFHSKNCFFWKTRNSDYLVFTTCFIMSSSTCQLFRESWPGFCFFSIKRMFTIIPWKPAILFFCRLLALFFLIKVLHKWCQILTAYLIGLQICMLTKGLILPQSNHPPKRTSQQFSNSSMNQINRKASKTVLWARVIPIHDEISWQENK